MRPLVLLIVALYPIAALSDTFDLTIEPDHALVTPGGALVTYKATVDLPAGQHRLKLLVRDVHDIGVLLKPPAFEGTGAVSILATQASPAVPERSPRPDLAQAVDALSKERRRLQALETQVAGFEAEISASDQQLALVDTLTQGNFGAASTAWPSQIEDLMRTLELISKQTKAALDLKRQADLGIERLQPVLAEVERAVEDARRRVELLSYADDHAAQILLDVAVKEPFAGAVSFGVHSALRWEPRYELHVAQDGAHARIRLDRHANLYALPKAGFSDLSVTLSTAALSARTDSSVPISRWKDLFDPSKVQMSREMMATPQIVVSAPAEAIFDDGPQFELRGQTAVFDLPLRLSAQPNAETLSIALDQLGFAAPVFGRANATQDETAYLYTTLVNDTGGILLPGQALILRNGVAIGETGLPQIFPGQSEEIGLGPLLGIQVRRDVITNQRGESGLLTSTSQRSHQWRTSLSSTLDYALRVDLLDVVPTSRHKDLQIDLIARPAPDVTDRDGQKGVLVWKLDIAPGAIQTVDFGYDMSWPAEMELK